MGRELCGGADAGRVAYLKLRVQEHRFGKTPCGSLRYLSARLKIKDGKLNLSNKAYK